MPWLPSSITSSSPLIIPSLGPVPGPRSIYRFNINHPTYRQATVTADSPLLLPVRWLLIIRHCHDSPFPSTTTIEPSPPCHLNIFLESSPTFFDTATAGPSRGQSLNWRSTIIFSIKYERGRVESGQVPASISLPLALGTTRRRPCYYQLRIPSPPQPSISISLFPFSSQRPSCSEAAQESAPARCQQLPIQLCPRRR